MVVCEVSLFRNKRREREDRNLLVHYTESISEKRQGKREKIVVWTYRGAAGANCSVGGAR